MYTFNLTILAASIALDAASGPPEIADPHVRHFDIEIDSLRTPSALPTYPLCLTDATEMSLHFSTTRGTVDLLDMNGRWQGSASTDGPVTVAGECVYIQVTHGSFVLDGVTVRFAHGDGLHPWQGEDASSDPSVELVQTEVVVQIDKLDPGQSVRLTDAYGHQQQFTEIGQHASKRFASDTPTLTCLVDGAAQPDATCDARIVSQQQYGVAITAADDRMRCHVFGTTYSCSLPTG